MNSATDAEFIFSLLSSPKFIKYIGDRGVRSVSEAATFIETRYRQSYRDHGFGLYTVVTRSDQTPVGICGFVKRDNFVIPDIGFAFLPEHERKGFGFESAAALMLYGEESLGFSEVLAITTPDNDASGNLLLKLGFEFDGLTDMPNGETLRLYRRRSRHV